MKGRWKGKLILINEEEKTKQGREREIKKDYYTMKNVGQSMSIWKTKQRERETISSRRQERTAKKEREGRMEGIKGERMGRGWSWIDEMMLELNDRDEGEDKGSRRGKPAITDNEWR